jgi:hypothetical protein
MQLKESKGARTLLYNFMEDNYLPSVAFIFADRLLGGELLELCRKTRYFPSHRA